MTKKDFNRELDAITTNGRIDKAKAQALPDEKKIALVHEIVRSRCPVMVELIVDSERSWLSSMGYGYPYTNKAGYSFSGTCEHYVAHKSKMERERTTLTQDQRKQALKWYANDNYDLQTIGQHFGLNIEQIKRELNNVFG